MADRRALYTTWIAELVADVSLDPLWRARVFNAPPRGAFDVAGDDIDRLGAALATAIRENALRFEVFHDGLGDGSAVVFGFRSLEFPDIEAYSTNYPRAGHDDVGPEDEP
ncbi:MAG TPA: hypothetical protein VE093_08095 [Polyangiaceae bacterium]|nr:hypothetical protein [Polyangiaceae bacterium]